MPSFTLRYSIAAGESGRSCWNVQKPYRNRARNRARTLARLATAYHRTGQAAERLRVTIDGLAGAEETDERNYTAEIYRLKDEPLLALSEDKHPEATGCFLQALAIARGLHTKSWEPRAATSLARLWQQQGKREQGHKLLVLVYDWLTEGFDTADLQEAKALLDALA